MFFEAHQAKCSPMILVSGNISLIRFTRIFAWFSVKVASNDSGVVDKGNFQCFSLAISSKTFGDTNSFKVCSKDIIIFL